MMFGAVSKGIIRYASTAISVADVTKAIPSASTEVNIREVDGSTVAIEMVKASMISCVPSIHPSVVLGCPVSAFKAVDERRPEKIDRIYGKIDPKRPIAVRVSPASLSHPDIAEPIRTHGSAGATHQENPQNALVR